MTKLLALGGSKNLEWLPDYGNQEIAIAVMPTFKAYTLDGNYTSIIDLAPPSPTDLTPMLETMVYSKSTLGWMDDNGNYYKKQVYIFQETSKFEALEILKEWLLGAFIRMDNPE